MLIELGSLSLGSVIGTVVGAIAGHFFIKICDKKSHGILDDCDPLHFEHITKKVTAEMP